MKLELKRAHEVRTGEWIDTGREFAPVATIERWTNERIIEFGVVEIGHTNATLIYRHACSMLAVGIEE